MKFLNLLPDRAYLQECFTYDPLTGTLFWKDRPRSHFNSDRAWISSVSQNHGRIAGCCNYKASGRAIVRRQPRNALLPKWVKPNGKGFSASVRHNGEAVHLGTWPTPDEAHRVAFAEALRLQGEFCRPQ